MKGEVRGGATVEVLGPSAIEGENVSYEALGPAGDFRPSFCFLRHVTVALCNPRTHRWWTKGETRDTGDSFCWVW